MIRTLPLRLAVALAPLLLIGTPPVFAQARAEPVGPDPALQAWGIAGSDVAPERGVRYGVLPNGMKYALMRNTTPKDSVVVRMRIKVGSLYEAEDQRGLAHFLEHMAFNGSTNVPEGEMIKLLERKGLAFGADTNASTGFEETTYKLDLPKASDDLIDTALMLMRETGSELTIAAEAVDRERGVVLSERRTRDTFQLKNVVDNLQFLFGGTRIPDRLPIGTIDVISKAPPERIRDLYERYYRPERTTLVMVGDFDLDKVEKKLRERFADWQGKGTPGVEPMTGTIDFQRPQAVDIFTGPELAETVAITRMRPFVRDADTLAQRRQDLLESIGPRIVNRRLSRAILSEDTPASSASVGLDDAFDLTDTLGMSASAKEGGWKEAMALVEREYRRAQQFGFTEGEVKEQLAQLETAYRNAAASADTRRSESLADALVRSADGDFVFASPADRLKQFLDAKDAITADSVTQAFRTATEGFGQPLIRVTARSAIAGGEQSVATAWKEALAVNVQPPQDSALAAFGYTDFGPAGTVVSDTVIADLGIRRIRFRNNVMLNLKKTDFEKDIVRLSVRVDGGALLNTRDDPTRTYLAGVLNVGGLKKHSFDDLRSILAGRTVSPGFGVGSDSFGGVVSTRPQDLELQAELMTAFLTEPGYRPEGLTLVRRYLPTSYTQDDATPDAVIARDVSGLLSGGDPRFTKPSLDRVMALDWEGLKPVLADPFATGAVEIGVVGDIDEAATIAAIARTFGALPTRAAKFEPRIAARKIAFATDRSTRTLIHKSDADQAVVQLYWPTTDDSLLGRDTRFDLLAAVMRLKLIEELRERLGKTYGGVAYSDTSDIYPGYGHFAASVAVDPKDMNVTEATIRQIAADLAAKPIDTDTMDRARKPLIESSMKARRENGYWMRYVARASSQPARLDRSRKAIGELERATPAELQALAKRWLVPGKAMVIRAVSDKLNEAATPAPSVAPAPASADKPAN